MNIHSISKEKRNVIVELDAMILLLSAMLCTHNLEKIRKKKTSCNFTVTQ